MIEGNDLARWDAKRAEVLDEHYEVWTVRGMNGKLFVLFQRSKNTGYAFGLQATCHAVWRNITGRARMDEKKVAEVWDVITNDLATKTDAVDAQG